MKYFFIMNPESQGGKSKKKISLILEYLDKNKVDYDYILSSSLDEILLLSREANKKDCDAIVAVGGDGTINRVANGFFSQDSDRISNKKFGVIHTGTSPDFCKSYNIPTKPLDALKNILQGQARKINIGKITFTNEDKSILDTKYFLCCANIGLGAILARTANSGVRKYCGDMAGTFLSLLYTLFKYKADTFSLILNGKKVKVEKLFNLAIGITPFIASGIQINPKLIKNNELYGLLVQKMKFFHFPSVIRKIYGGKEFQNNEVVSIMSFEEIEVEKNSQNPEVEFDGDPYGYLPCKIKIMKNALDLIVGKN